MIIQNMIKSTKVKNQATYTLPDVVQMINPVTTSGQVVGVENSKNVATAYRCINIISDDVAKMPLQTFISMGEGSIDRVKPNWSMNIAYLLEVSPNRRMVPFIFKKTMMQWLICHGNAYAWSPLAKLGMRPEINILPADETWPVYDKYGNIWYRTQFPNGDIDYLPDVEVLHLMINSTDGLTGKSVISYARESIGRQLGAYETQGNILNRGLSAAGLLWLTQEMTNPVARNKVREELEKAISGSENAARVALMDPRFSKFESITMKPIDVQFLEGISENDTEIANFFGVPQYKLNAGKQSYESNEQQDLDYLKTTLDPYLVQWEEGAKLRWLPEREQLYTYFRFNRDVILRTNAKTRTEVLTKRIQSGQLSLNEARQIEDTASFAGGDIRIIPSNMAVVNPDGSVTAIAKTDSSANQNNYDEAINEIKLEIEKIKVKNG